MNNPFAGFAHDRRIPTAAFYARLPQAHNGARTTRYGYELSGSVADFEYLVGWVAGEANHSPDGSGRGLMLDDIAESIEAGLVTGGDGAFTP